MSLESNGLKPLSITQQATLSIFFISKDWFNVTLDQLVQRHKKGVTTGGVLYVEKVNRTLDFDV